MGSQRVGHDWATDLIWSDLIGKRESKFILFDSRGHNQGFKVTWEADVSLVSETTWSQLELTQLEWACLGGNNFPMVSDVEDKLEG